MFKWEKMGLIWNPCEDIERPAWRWNYAQGVNTLIYDEYVRVYFCTREKPDEGGRTRSRIAWLDLDRYDLTKVLRIAEQPILGLGELGRFDEHGMYPFSVIRHDGKIYGYYGGVSRCESVPFDVSIGMCISNDNGNTFARIGEGPILTASKYEPFVICSPKIRIYDGKWYMFYSAGKEWIVGKSRPEIYYKLRLATSDDGVNWVKHNKDIISDKIGKTEAQACGDVTYANGKYHMFFCYRKNEDFRRNKSNSYRIGYAWSYDLYDWYREDNNAGLDISDDGWDSEMVAYPHVFNLDGQYYMLYLGNEVGKYGFGMAKLIGDLI